MAHPYILSANEHTDSIDAKSNGQLVPFIQKQHSSSNGVSDEDPCFAVADRLLSCGHTQPLECIWDPFLNGHPKVQWQQGSPYPM